MNFTITSRVAAAALAVGIFAGIGVSDASAASQTISASLNASTAANFYVNANWADVTGATSYKIFTSNAPAVDSTDTLWTTTTTSALSKQMTTAPGYRYFRVYAYNSAGTLLSYSNVFGAAKYESGLVVKMKTDSALTATYPSSTAANYQKPTWFITLDSTVKSSYVAANFQLGEFISESTITSGIVDPLMVSHVQNARSRYGVMSLNSGYRTPNHNASVGGATFSRHMYGDAIDVPAATTSVFNSLKTAFAPEYPSYIEPYDQASNNHYHGDWRDEAKGYQNW
jgi:hypothetical protein